MDIFIREYWDKVFSQDRNSLPRFFTPDAYIKWHCTNEKFNVNEFVIANCDYPGDWRGELERIEKSGSIYITATRVWDNNSSFHAVSFFQIEDGLIKSLDEYWGDDGEAPQWRQDKKIGTSIKS